MKKPIYALIDCNNFFVSCERIFRPDLHKQPVVVLSSNDGCAIARSNEVKALGVPMGAPAFKYKDIFIKHGVVQFSANFELYADISRRITELLSGITPRIEIYSIDESFLDITALPLADVETWGREVRQNILDWIGVPVSIGIAHSKTLAKLASERAKKDSELNGVLSLACTTKSAKEMYLKRTPVQDIWGIGRQLAPRLKSEGVITALDLSCMRPRHIQQRLGIHGRQIVAELNDTACLALTLKGRKPKSIMATRTFGQDCTDLGSLEAAVATFTATAAFKLRRSGQMTKRASLFITTSRFKPNYRRWSKDFVFTVPLADTGIINTLLLAELRKLYQNNTAYHRAGVLLHDFIPKNSLQHDLLGVLDPVVIDKSQQRMEAIDTINATYGRKTITYAAQHLGKEWHPKKNIRSPRYTTEWTELAQL